MTKLCDYCELPFKEGDHVRAVVLSVYHKVPSAVSYAIERPYDCEKLYHMECRKNINV